MADFSASEVAFSGIRFVRNNLRTVAIWAGVQLVFSLLVQIVAVSTIGPALTSLRSLGGNSNPQQTLASMQKIMPFEGVAILASMVVYAIIYTTMNRVVLRPSDSRFAYLRLGMDEVRQFLVMLIWVVLGFIFEIVLAIAGGIVAAAIFGVGRGLQTAAPYLIIGVMLIGTVLAWAPFSLCFAQTFDRKRIMPFASARLVGGRYLKVCGAYFLAIVVGVVIWLLGTTISFALMGAAGGGVTLATMFTRAPVTTVGSIFTAPRLIALVIGAVLSPLLWTLLLMPAPEIYRRLSGASDPALDPSTFD